AQDRLIVALVERGIAAVVVEALTGIGRAPASAGPRRVAPLRARPALGVSAGEQQSHYCDTEQNKTDRAHGSSPSPSFRAANAKGEGTRVCTSASPPYRPGHVSATSSGRMSALLRKRRSDMAGGGFLAKARGFSSDLHGTPFLFPPEAFICSLQR